MEKIKVLLADDHALFREGLSKVLESDKQISIVGEAEDGLEVVKRAKELLPDVVLLDISMPGIHGIEATSKIKETCPNSKIIIVTMHEDDQHLFKAIRVGAAAYIVKNSSTSDMIRTVKEVAAGRSFLTPELSKRILNEFANLSKARDVRQNTPFSKLTKREMEVLRQLASAKTSYQIGRSLFISERTVRNHICNIYAKLQVNARMEAVLKALKLGVVDLDSL